MTQPTLWDAAARADPPTIQERFEAFHAAHPDVYALFRRFAGELRAAGRTRFGAKALAERIRWHYATTSGGGPDFKLNNNFVSRYARLLAADDPAFEGFFERRRLRA